MFNTNKKETISFRFNVPAGGVPVIKRERVKAAGTCEKVSVRFYAGQQLALQVNPYVLHTRGRAENLVTYAEGTDNFLAGDDDVFPMESVVTVATDDEILVWASNTDTVFDYTCVVDVVLDYYGGMDRVV